MVDAIINFFNIVDENICIPIEEALLDFLWFDTPIGTINELLSRWYWSSSPENYEYINFIPIDLITAIINISIYVIIFSIMIKIIKLPISILDGINKSTRIK